MHCPGESYPAAAPPPSLQQIRSFGGISTSPYFLLRGTCAGAWALYFKPDIRHIPPIWQTIKYHVWYVISIALMVMLILVDSATSMLVGTHSVFFFMMPLELKCLNSQLRFAPLRILLVKPQSSSIVRLL